MTSCHFLLSKVESIVLSEEGYKGRSFEGDRKSQGKKIPARRRMLTRHYFFRPLGFLFGFRESQNTNKCSFSSPEEEGDEWLLLAPGQESHKYRRH